MWILTIRSPAGEPREYAIQPGNNTIGRMPGNDIVILDPSASRHHAKIVYESEDNTLYAQDLESTNGTFVNRDRITESQKLTLGDVVRIGQHVMELKFWNENDESSKTSHRLDTRQLTRELVLESLDTHAVLLAEVSARLNTVTDINAALGEVAELMKASMGADRCEVILANRFGEISKLGFATSIAQQALQQRSAVIVEDAQKDPSLGKSAFLLHIHAAMCVPVLSGNQILGLIYVFKNRSRARPFDQRDLQLAIAIGHQAALTIQRMQLMERIQHEELVSKLLQRFLSPQEAQFALRDYLNTGQLPPLDEHNLTILAADICDSTGLAERLGSRRFGLLLSRYYQEMTEIVFKYNGMLNKYIGDGLMAVFGLPYQPEDHEERAVRAAIKMLDRLAEINSELSESISIGIGINTGPTIAGYMGTMEYVEFTTIGYPVNIAWRLESIARPNRIMIGHPTYQKVHHLFGISTGELVEFKEQEKIQVYEVHVDSPKNDVAN